MPEVVCNTTPLQYLHQAGVLWILPKLYGRILIPQAVTNEIGAGLNAGVNSPDLTTHGWIEVREVTRSPWPIPRDIHRGEAEVIALAGSLPNSKMILDDLAARKHAHLLGLKFTGTLGILLHAKEVGLLDALLPVVNCLEQSGFRLAESTRKDFLSLAGES
jgi:predicted nucleic acid-binding protein